MRVAKFLFALGLLSIFGSDLLAKDWTLRLKNDSKEKIDIRINGHTYTIGSGNYRDIGVTDKSLVYASSTNNSSTVVSGQITVQPPPSGGRGQVSVVLSPLVVGKDEDGPNYKYKIRFR